MPRGTSSSKVEEMEIKLDIERMARKNAERNSGREKEQV